MENLKGVHRMKINVPMTSSISYFSIIPHIVMLGIFSGIFYVLNFSDYLTYGLLTFLLLYFIVRNLVPIEHRKGVKLMKKLKYKDSVSHFEKSVMFFSKYPWIDKYRCIFLLSTSKMTYKEMALCNIAFAFGQIGDGRKAKTLYEEIIKEYPNNGIVLSAINMYK
jgi:hypothetical protein